MKSSGSLKMMKHKTQRSKITCPGHIVSGKLELKSAQWEEACCTPHAPPLTTSSLIQ